MAESRECLIGSKRGEKYPSCAQYPRCICGGPQGEERGAFEDWAVKLSYATRRELATWRNEFGYARKDLDHLWLGWQGRANNA